MIKKIVQHLAKNRKLQGSLVIVFTNDSQMKDLNCRFKGKNSPTDVLAFDLAENKGNDYIESEIYVNLQAARRQAVEYDVEYSEEVTRLCCHGFLHLLGYDDLTADDKKIMWQIQESYLKKYL